jgi:hypothetical protein
MLGVLVNQDRRAAPSTLCVAAFLYWGGNMSRRPRLAAFNTLIADVFFERPQREATFS